MAGVDLTVHPIKPLDVTVGWELRARRAIIDSHFTQPPVGCLLYTSDAADDLIGGELGCRRMIKKKKEYVS